MLGALESAFEQVRADSAARVVVLGAAGKAFCAGHDLKEMKARTDLAYFQSLFARCSRFMLSIQQLPVPVIARVQGLATAAGCQLVAQCDLAVAVDTARFGVNGIDAGLFCATPSVPLVRNMAPKLAMEMLVTGEFITAAEAKMRGLVNRVVEPSLLDEELERLVGAILSKPREALAMGKHLFYLQREMGVAGAYQLASQTMAFNMVHPVAQEGVQAFIDKREPQWPT
jgi:enoyl-CoA hydratase/carnithine racemase